MVYPAARPPQTHCTKNTLRYHTLPKPDAQQCPDDGNTTGPAPRCGSEKWNLSRASP